MSRLNKKTRIKRLPPVLELQRQDSITGSYPTTVRFSSDGRTGKYPVFYNDTATLNYNYATGSIDVVVSAAVPASNLSALRPYLYSYYPINNQTTSSTTVFPPSYATASSGLSLSSLTFALSGSAPNYIRFEDGNTPYLTSLTQSSVYVSGGWDFSIGGTGDLRIVPRSGALSITSSTAFDFSTGAFSFTCWMKKKYAGSGTDIVAYRSHVSGYQFLLTVSQTFSVGLMPNYNIYNSVGVIKRADFGGGNIYDGNWHFLAFTYDGNNFDLSANDQNRLNLYFDGQNMGGVFVNSKLTGSAMSGGIGDIKVGAGFESGSIAHFAFWKKELTSQEINSVYQNQNNLLDFDGRAAVINQLKIGEGIEYGSGLVPGSIYCTAENTSSLSGSGYVRKGIGDSLVHFTPGQDLTPFNETFLIESDVKASNNDFYATGSANPDFDSPLWSKQKIAIDLTPTIEQSFSIQNTTENYPVLYWNNVNKTWEGIGDGLPFSTYFSSGPDFISPYTNFLRNTCIAMSPSMHFTSNSRDSVLDKNNGSFITNFGFPNSDKYHATQSQLVDMSSYISKPFIVEKVALIFNGKLDINSSTFFDSIYSSMTSFVILNQNNQRKNNYYNVYENNNLWYKQYLGTSKSIFQRINTQFSQLSSSREIVGKINILGCNIATALSNSQNNYVYSNKSWSSNSSIVFSGSLGIENDISGSGIICLYDFVEHNFVDIRYYRIASDTSYLPMDSLLSPRRKNTIKNDTNYVLSGVYDFKYPYDAYNSIPIRSINKNYSESHYILMPNDKLVFSWHLPYPEMLTSQRIDNTNLGYPQYVSTIAGAQDIKLTLQKNMPSKIIFYGSYVENGKEYNETTNQLLSSNTIHEVIG